MTQHTPGPWEVRPSNNEIVNADHGLLPFAIRAGYTLIGALYANGADARLIAAAPELLEACKAALSDDQPYIEKCRAAIAKATGGEV